MVQVRSRFVAAWPHLLGDQLEKQLRIRHFTRLRIQGSQDQSNGFRLGTVAQH